MLEIEFWRQTLFSLLVSASVKAVLIVAVFLVAWIVLAIVKGLIRKLIEYLELEEKLEEKGLHDALFGFKFVDVVNFLVSLYILLLALAVAGDVAQIPVLVEWSVGLLDYFPRFVQGIVILVLGLYIGDYIGDRIRDTDIVFSGILGGGVQFFIIYNAIVMALPAMFPAISTALLENVFLLVFAAFAFGAALALGLSLGLGAKPVVEEIVKKNKKKLSELF